MPPLSGNRIAWTYHSDDTTTYRVSAEKALTDQAVLGGEAAAADVKAKPASIKMRRISLNDRNGHSRVVPVYSKDAPILTLGATISVNLLGTPTTFYSSGFFLNEKARRQTSQST